MKKANNIIFLLIIIFLSSCGNKLKNYTTSSTGKNGEILVVSDKSLWRGEVKDTITNFLISEQYGLPQPEPKFSVFAIPYDEFNRILRPHRSIFMLDIDAAKPNSTLEITKDKWASPQVIIKLSSPSRDSLIEKFWTFRESISKYFIESEYRRYQKTAEKIEEPGLTKSIEDKYKFSMIFPSGYGISKSTDNFFWIRKESKEFSQGVLFYTYDYSNKNQIEQETILFVRDTITKNHIPGPSDSSYMKVSKKLYLPESTIITFQGMYCIETRGLWQVENDFMGGPFVNYTIVDDKNKKIIVFDGYVYAPRDNKRDILRAIEAIIYTWKPLENKK